MLLIHDIVFDIRIFVHIWRSQNVLVALRRRYHIWRWGTWTHFVHMFFVLNQEWYVFHFVNVWKSSAWGRNYKLRPQARSFNAGPQPQVLCTSEIRTSCCVDGHNSTWKRVTTVYSQPTWHHVTPLHACDEISQTSPHCICIQDTWTSAGWA